MLHRQFNTERISRKDTQLIYTALYLVATDHNNRRETLSDAHMTDTDQPFVKENIIYNYKF